MTLSYQLREQVRGTRLERQIAKLINDQQLRFGEVRQLLLEPAFRMPFTSVVIRLIAATNSTEYPSRIASRPSATAR